jgi:radical SAM superfamily enzyme YgiQ (UPF0313 family)
MVLSNVNPPILFVNPSLGTKSYEEEDKLRSYLSLGTLAGALRNRAFLKRFADQLGKEEIILTSKNDYPEFDIFVLNLSLKPARLSNREYFYAFLKHLGHTPLMICMTATSAHLDEAREIARTARQLVPAALRIIGGPHVTVAAEEFLSRSEFQAACIGEGVETLAEIALRVAIAGGPDLSTIEGINYKLDNGKVYSNPLRVPLFDLDEYPFPSDSLDFFRGPAENPAENQNHLIYILSGYGCPHDCIFCAQRRIHGRKIRERSADNIVEEIRCLYDRGFRKFAFVQETFLNHKKRMETFCRLIEDSGMQIEWTAEARADQLDYGHLERMQSAGLQFIQIGVESGDPELLKKLGKGIDLDQIIQIRNWCSQLKINTAFYLLVGLPGQDWQSLLRTALFMKDHPPFNRITKHAAVSIAIPYPGTRMWQEQTVRLVDIKTDRTSWPQRNPEVIADDAGRFVGENYTETDDLTANEILEAWIYLDDFCHFLLHAIDPGPKNSTAGDKSMDYAGRMFYMIQRRTIRDLIVRAQANYTAAKRKAAYDEIVTQDEDIETHFKDITVSTEPVFDVFIRFLSAAKFLNGFETMRWLNIGNRIKWMKICALLWHLKGRKVSGFRFERDDKKAGFELDRHLQAVNESQLNRYLVQIDAGISPHSFADICRINKQYSAFGIRFSHTGIGIFEISYP